MRITKEESRALIIDIQEKLFPCMYDYMFFLERIKRLIAGLNTLEIPVILTEQYSKGLGKTINTVKSLMLDIKPLEKIAFSCCDERSVMELIENSNRKYIIVAGIEAHVCVLQTVIDLIETGFIPVVVTDCISSRNENDKTIAIKRISNEGGILTTYESILLELCRNAGHEKFKAISAIIK